MRSWLFWRNRDFAPPPLMHLTHGKAGSTWIDLILRDLFPGRVAPRLYAFPPQFIFDKHQIYSAIFMTREQFLGFPELAKIKRFVVIRDLRDTLISQYFSMRDTHELDPGGIVEERRAILRSSSFEEGLRYLLEKALTKQAAIQRSWAGSGEIVLRYEDLIARDVELLREVLIDRLTMPLTPAALEKVVLANRFEAVFKRKLGEEDASSHGRKGAPGDWRNHFTPALAREFHSVYGDLLATTGYEQDAAWVESLT